MLEWKTSVPNITLRGGVFVGSTCFLGRYDMATEYAGVLLPPFGLIWLNGVQFIAFWVWAPDIDGIRHSLHSR